MIRIARCLGFLVLGVLVCALITALGLVGGSEKSRRERYTPTGLPVIASDFIDVELLGERTWTGTVGTQHVWMYSKTTADANGYPLLVGEWNRVDAGWPIPWLGGEWLWDRRARLSGSYTIKVIELGITLPRDPRVGILCDPIFPMLSQVSWWALAANAVVFGSVGWLVWCLARWIWRVGGEQKARASGVCASCGYPVGVLPVCTECGAGVAPKVSEQPRPAA